MEGNMKVCKICKTPVDEIIAIEVNGEFVHPGHCLALLKETKSNLNESANADEIQLIM